MGVKTGTIIGFLVAVALSVAACGSSGDSKRASNTGPSTTTNVQCEETKTSSDGSTGDTIINVTVDCGDRDSNNTGKPLPAE